MKYMLKKIIIGVSIGLILFYCKSCNVHAATTYSYLYNATNVVATYDVDVCTEQDSNLLCVNGFSGQTALSRGNNLTYIKQNNNNNLALKSFSLSATFADRVALLYQYASLTGNLSSILYSSSYGALVNTKLNWNQYLFYVKITSQDDTECIATNVGATYQSGANYPLPYFQVPSACRGKYVKQIDIIWQSGYNYSGSNNILEHFDDTGTLEEKISKNRNNTYLAYIPSGRVLATERYLGNVQLYSSNSNAGSYGSTWYKNDFTQSDLEIQENLSQLNQELLISSAFIGSDNFSQEQGDEFSSGFSSILSNASSSLNSVGFTDFLNSLIVTPISLLNNSASKDFYTNENGYSLTGDLCFDSFTQGGGNYGWIPIPFMESGDFRKDNFQVPCLTRDVYFHLKSDNFSVVGNNNITSQSTNIAVQGGSLLAIWLLLQHGILFYFLVITFVNIVKYCIDTKESEIEVLEL